MVLCLLEKFRKRAHTHKEVKRVLFVLLNHISSEELASKKVRGHEGSIFSHSDLIRTELHPVCQLKHANQNTTITATEMYSQSTEVCETCPWQQINSNKYSKNRITNYNFGQQIKTSFKINTMTKSIFQIGNVRKQSFRFQFPGSVDNASLNEGRCMNQLNKMLTTQKLFCVTRTAENRLTLF